MATNSWSQNRVELTREDPATDGDISSEGAFLVNVSAFNSLGETKGNMCQWGMREYCP